MWLYSTCRSLQPLARAVITYCLRISSRNEFLVSNVMVAKAPSAIEISGRVMCQKESMIFQYQGNWAQPSEVRPRSGKMLKNDPPANRMINRIANRNPGIANPTMITAEVQVSNFEPSMTALRMRGGIEIR